MNSVPLPQLPCYPCPHQSICCSWGATVSEEEAQAIAADHGEGKVYETRWGELRTRIKGGRCIFFVDQGCSIHDKSYYPEVCRGFPWHDAETGGPYQFDRTICPEFLERPELQEVFPYHPPKRTRRKADDAASR